MWVLDHLPDLEADFLVFYRIDISDPDVLTGPRFLSLALRVFAYQGVMAALAVAQQEEQAGGGNARNGAEVRVVESSRAAISADPALGQLVSWGTG
jgi:hypothetical protein